MFEPFSKIAGKFEKQFDKIMLQEASYIDFKLIINLLKKVGYDIDMIEIELLSRPILSFEMKLESGKVDINKKNELFNDFNKESIEKTILEKIIYSVDMAIEFANGQKDFDFTKIKINCENGISAKLIHYTKESII